MVSLNSAKLSCQVATPAESCQRNNGGNNLQTSAWYGDDGSNPDLECHSWHSERASDLLYATQTKRDAFAAYSQAAIELNEKLTLTLGIRYAEDKLLAEENLWRYSETGAAPGGFLGLYGGFAQVNITNGGLIKDADGNYTVPTPKATNGGIPFALSVYRPFERTDTKTTGRINLDWDINDSTMMYFSATSGYRSGGYSLVYFSTTPTYDPEELIAYEIGYKSQLFDDTLQLNASAYMYDYSSIHTFTTEVGQLGGTTTSVLAAPGGEVMGLEAEALWLATDRLTVGGNFSFTPSEYTESFRVSDTSRTATFRDRSILNSIPLLKTSKGISSFRFLKANSPDGQATMSLSMVAIRLNSSVSTAGSMKCTIRRSSLSARWRPPTDASMRV
jgi:outer membrane receptor protein involved in Fe transport